MNHRRTNEFNYFSDEELLRTATLSGSGPQILQDTTIAPRMDHSENGNCLRILTVDLGTDSNQLDRLHSP